MSSETAFFLTFSAFASCSFFRTLAIMFISERFCMHAVSELAFKGYVVKGYSIKKVMSPRAVALKGYVIKGYSGKRLCRQGL